MLSRLKYIEVEKERNIKTAQWAKRKYSLIVERRMENLQMRSMIGEVWSGHYSGTKSHRQAK